MTILQRERTFPSGHRMSNIDQRWTFGDGTTNYRSSA